MLGKNVLSLALAGAFVAASSNASALLVVDGWEVDTSGAPILNMTANSETNIGHLNLSGGDATVEQEVNGSGTPFVNADFQEFGAIFSVSATTENIVGAGDTGSQALLGTIPSPGLFQLEFVFAGLAGTVTSYDSGSGAIEYAFTPGVGTVTMYGWDYDGTDVTAGTQTWLADYTLIAPSGGDLADFSGVASQDGQSTITLQVTNAATGVFQDQLGNSLVADLVNDPLFADVVLTNKITSAPVSSGNCTFDATADCVTTGVTSDGSLDHLVVPEPGMIALFSIGMLGLGAAARSRRKS